MAEVALQNIVGEAGGIVHENPALLPLDVGGVVVGEHLRELVEKFGDGVVRSRDHILGAISSGRYLLGLGREHLHIPASLRHGHGSQGLRIAPKHGRRGRYGSPNLSRNGHGRRLCPGVGGGRRGEGRNVALAPTSACAAAGRP